jgi:hypothetical protein
MHEQLHRNKRRQISREQAYGLITSFVEPLQESGFYGRVPLELELQDGIVMVVRATGNLHVMRIPPPEKFVRSAA